jgi:hypothetical protein
MSTLGFSGINDTIKVLPNILPPNTEGGMNVALTSDVNKGGMKGGDPSPDDPIEEVGDEIHVNIENLRTLERQGIPIAGNPVFDANPVCIFNYSDFHIDREGNFYINYNTGRKNYGRIDEDNNFVASEDVEVKLGPQGLGLWDAKPNGGHLNYGVRSVSVKPGNIIKIPRTNEGVFKTPGLPLEKYRGSNLSPIFFDRDHPYTLDQVREYMTYANRSDFSIGNNHSLKKTLNAGMYIIYHKKSNKMYSQYEFVKAVFTDPKKKTHGYLVFKKSEPMRKRDLKTLAPLVEDLKLRPNDNPASIIGQDYRAAKQHFEEEAGQVFTEGNKYDQVVREIKKTRRASPKGGRTKKRRAKKH